MDKPGHGEDAPEAAAGELAHQCALCRAPISGDFYLLRGLVVCSGCAQGIKERQAGPGRLRRALLYGAITAAVSALLWFLGTVGSGRPLSGLAILAGIAIGLAMHQGSGGRGGLRYQLSAALLVYAAFVVRYIPPVFGGIADAIKKEHTAATAIEGKARSDNVPAVTANSDTAASSKVRPSDTPLPSPRTSTLHTLKAYFVFAAIAWGLVLASPFMPRTSGLLAALWLAVGMALAFHLNRRARLRGPFSEIG